MGIHDELKGELTKSVKAHDRERVGTLRYLLSALHNREIEKRSSGQNETLLDEDVRAVLGKEAKRRTEAIELFRQGGRDDLAAREEKELQVIREYLPTPLTREEIEREVEALVGESSRDFPSVMREAMGRMKGRADGALVGEIIKKKLGDA